MKNRFLIFTLILCVVIIVIGVLKFKTLEGIAFGKETVAGKAPDFTLLDLNGNEKSLHEFDGKIIILDFWATWCPPCRAEVPHFVALYNEYKDRGLEVIGVALDRGGVKAIEAFLQDNSINYTVLLGNDKVADLYGGIMSIPTTFIIDKERNIVKKYIGYRDKEVFEYDIKELLN